MTTFADPPIEAQHAAVRTSSVEHQHRWSTLTILALAQLMVVLDATIVNIALPTAQASLGFSDSGRQWVVTGYALAFGSLLLLGGRLSDFFGRKRMFIIGLVGFALASALGGASQGFAMLVFARVAQGAFAAILAPASLSLLSVSFTDPIERGKAFGIYGAISGAGGGVGLLLGGLLTEYASWRWCLYVNLIIAAIAIIGAVSRVHESERPARPSLDLPGVATSVLGLVALVYGLGNSENHGWASPSTWAFSLVGVVLLIAFVIIERSSTHPLLPMRVVLDRNRGASFLAAGISGVGMFGIFLFLTYYLSNTLGYTPVRTGLAFLPMMAFVITSATIAGSVLMAKVGPRPLVTSGAVTAAVGLLLMLRLNLDSTYLGSVLPALAIVGIGLGLVFAPIQNGATSGVDHGDAGVASAMINTTQQIGGSIGTAVLSSFAATAASHYLDGRAPSPDVLAHASISSYHTVFVCSAVVFVACALLSAALFKSGPLAVDPDADPVIAH